MEYNGGAGNEPESAPTDSKAAQELRQIKRILIGTLATVVIGGGGFLLYRDNQQDKERERKEVECLADALMADEGQQVYMDEDCLN